MKETCDRCGPSVSALYRADRRGELYLCGHCARQLRPALSAQGWTISSAGEQAPIPSPGLVPVEGRPHNIRLDPPRRRRQALLDFLAIKLIRRKNQKVWPSEAALPRRARKKEEK
jgi:hypothetical protein